MNNEEHHHEPNYKEPIIVFIGLIILTLLTVGVSGITANATIALVIALVIASLKGSLVLAYFMHLKYESPIFNWFGLVVLFTLISIIVLIFTDYTSRSL